MDRRLPPGNREIAGATLTVSTMGGFGRFGQQAAVHRIVLAVADAAGRAVR